MNNIRIKVYKKLLKEISGNSDGVKDFINDMIEEIYSYEKLSTEKIICFFSSKIVSSYEI